VLSPQLLATPLDRLWFNGYYIIFGLKVWCHHVRSLLPSWVAPTKRKR